MKQLLAISLLLAASLPLIADDGAATAPETPAFDAAVDVELVVVEVIAETRRGEPVLDLTREDFALEVDGEPVPISQFTAPDPGGAGRPAAANRRGDAGGAAEPQSIIVFVDDVHLSPGSRTRVFAELIERLDDFLDKDDRVMVVAASVGTRVVQPMTSSRRKLEAALREHALHGAVNLMAVNEAQRALEDIARVREQYALVDGPGQDSGSCRDVGHIADAYARQAHGRVLGTIAELEGFVATLAAFPGPKILLHVSDGISLVPGTEGYRFAAELCDGTGLNKGVPNATDTTKSTELRHEYWDPTLTEARLREFDTSKYWDQLADHANTYQVTFYTLQARQSTFRSTSVSNVRTSQDVEVAARRNQEAPLLLLADRTGGVATLNSNRLAPALERIENDAEHRYELAFVPPAGAEGERHAIRVEVGRPGVTLRHRQSYRTKSIEEQIADRLLAVLLYGEEDNPLDVELEIAPRPTTRVAAGNVTVRIQVPIGKLVLLPERGGERGLFTVFVAVRDQLGQLSRVRQKSIPVAVAPQSEAAKAFTFEVEVPFAAGTGEIAVGVRDDVGNVVSYLKTPVELAAGT